MVSSLIASQTWWIGDKKNYKAGTCRLLGFRCFQAPLLETILPPSLRDVMDSVIANSVTIWKEMSSTEILTESLQHVQKAWNGPVASIILEKILIIATNDNDKTRLLAAISPHSGDWLHAPPITALGLRLDNEVIRVAMVLGLDVKFCEPLVWHCNKMVDSRELHGFSCRKSTAWQEQHSHINNLIYTSILCTKTPAAKKPVGLIRTDSKCPDSSTLIPWVTDKPLAWYVIIIDSFAEFHISNTSTLAGEPANKATTNKIAKYSNLTTTHLHFTCHRNSRSIQQLGSEVNWRNWKAYVDYYKRTSWNLLLLPMYIHGHPTGKAVLFTSTFQMEWEFISIIAESNLTIFKPLGLC